jgi:succinate dehydrogenase/fumarate reductase cytochrome b subunit
MKAYTYVLLALLLLPNLAYAQFSLQKLFSGLLKFFNDALIPFLFGIAFLFFVINAVRYFVIEGSNEDGRANAKNLVLYSILAFVFLITFWGIINMLTSSIGLDGAVQVKSDYMP